MARTAAHAHINPNMRACACIDVDVSQDARMREVRMQTSERAFTKSNLNSLINAAPYRQEG